MSASDGAFEASSASRSNALSSEYASPPSRSTTATRYAGSENADTSSGWTGHA